MDEHPYDILASIYDAFQNRADTGFFFETILEELMRYIPNGGEESKPVVCDLGCGTGDMLLLLAQARYDVIGIDQSEQMLSIAQEKLLKNGFLGKWCCQDITEFDLADKVDVFLCLTDTINHIIDQNHLEQMFARVSYYLKTGGMFIFDTLTLDYIKNVLGDKSFRFEDDQYILVWDNSFDAQDMYSQSSLQLLEANNEGHYQRKQCVVREKYYSDEYIMNIIRQMKMNCLDTQFFHDGFDSEQNAVRKIYIAQCT